MFCFRNLTEQKKSEMNAFCKFTEPNFGRLDTFCKILLWSIHITITY